MVMNSREERQHSPSKRDDQRKEFQIDRDRILYSGAFRRLAQVTQVVSANEGSVFHNRLTHSLKVAQVGRRIAEKLLQDANILDSDLIKRCGDLDPDVVETAALSHDLGHPPFGHIAEKELDQLARSHGLSDGFEGNAQTFRILTRLEPHRSEYRGLNLTRATLSATLKYPWFCERDSGDNRTRKRSKKYSVYDLDREAFEFVKQASGDKSLVDQQTLEASIMDFADDITYSVHDLEDFYLAGLIPLRALAWETGEFSRFVEDWSSRISNNDLKKQIEKPDEQVRLRNLLKAYIPPRYKPGSIEEITHTKRVGSELIQRYIQSVSLRHIYGEHGYLERSQTEEIELQFLQQIVRRYVILNPRLTTQQFGQKKIIRTLFEVYKEAVEKGKTDLIPARFLKDSSLDNLFSVESGENQKRRIAIDIVASFSETEAIVMYRRFTGTHQGSVMDYIL
jgi:dGTPase